MTQDEVDRHVFQQIKFAKFKKGSFANKSLYIATLV